LNHKLHEIDGEAAIYVARQRLGYGSVGAWAKVNFHACIWNEVDDSLHLGNKRMVGGYDIIPDNIQRFRCSSII